MMSVLLDRASYAAGGTITATISMSMAKPIKARGLFASLTCSERAKEKTTVVLDQYTFDRHREMGIPYSSNLETRIVERDSILFSKEKQVSGGREFSGEEIFTVQFELPASATPTSLEYGHDNKIHTWKLCVRLDIPLAIDENAECDVFVEGL